MSPEEMAKSIVFAKKRRIKIDSFWNYVPKYLEREGVMVPALVRQRDQCGVAMAHCRMGERSPAEYGVAIEVMKEVKRLTEEVG
ncbi:hypothetical protein KAR91_85125 [Candidatus Pacearchaeota archaeon]|nr:hypothetical protein [Candidatus Pacearchaeota archaeon]